MAIVLSPVREKIMLYALMALQFTVIVDFMIMMPLSAQLLDAFNIGTTEFGLLVSAYSLSACVSSLLASGYSDRFDRKYALVACYIGLIIATFGCAISDSYNWLLISRVVAGFFGGIVGSLVLATIGDVIEPRRRGYAMGIVMLAFSLAAIFGVPLGLWISAHYHWQTPFLVLTVACIFILAICWFCLPNVREHLDQPKQSMVQSYMGLLSVPNHWWGFLTTMLVMFGGFLVIPYIAPTLVANGGMLEKDLTFVYLVGGAVTLVSRPYIAKLTDKFRHANVFLVLVIVSFIPIMLMSFSLNIPLYGHLLISALFFIFVSGRFIPTSAMVTASCEPKFRGRVMAFNSAMQNLGSGLAAFVGGMILIKADSGEILNYPWVGALSIVVGLISIVIARKIKPVS
ncbi:MFS transporter [Marinicellulosiphila megalodicopiae]|uniref:MFS transporter n=1 Tax=Marinicellulosiphila megalodicopiae TaxID=2724896 RepID=UPI003BB15186